MRDVIREVTGVPRPHSTKRVELECDSKVKLRAPRTLPAGPAPLPGPSLFYRDQGSCFDSESWSYDQLL